VLKSLCGGPLRHSLIQIAEELKHLDFVSRLPMGLDYPSNLLAHWAYELGKHEQGQGILFSQWLCCAGQLLCHLDLVQLINKNLQNVGEIWPTLLLKDSLKPPATIPVEN
jgi:hypothetical protein